MIIINNAKDLDSVLQNLRADNKTIGFVPTMGALHLGHISLIEQASSENDAVICSIYVNPTQFNNESDLKNYPRLLEADLKQLRNTSCYALYCPETADIYPDGALSEEFDFGDLEHVMEGKHRPGHFKGMATVVKRFLNAIKPDKAYFGEKDYQQLMVIKKLVKLEGIKTKIIGCPIVREVDGLAMSSRNMRLNAQQRHSAPSIFEALTELKSRAKVKSLDRSISKCVERINAHPYLAVEYLEIADSETLKPITDWNEAEHASAFVAVHAGEVRLIDNIQLY